MHPNLFLQVIKSPHVVVSPEQMHRNAGIGNFGQLAQQTYIAFRDNGFILKPKIKKVAQQKNFFGVGFYKIEPADKFLLPLAALRPVGDAEVEIGSEVDFISLFQNALGYGVLSRKNSKVRE